MFLLYPLHWFDSAAIPLVDPEFVPLPIHFVVDPGEQWSDDAVVVEVSEEAELLRQYLDVADIAIPIRSVPPSLTSSQCPTTDGTSSEASEKRTASWSELARAASVDSEDGLGTGSACGRKEKRPGSLKERKMDGKLMELANGIDDVTASGKTSTLSNKNKLPRQVQSVARSFGSLGRSFRKKLKKNFTSITRAMKQTDKTETKAIQRRGATTTDGAEVQGGVASGDDVLSAKDRSCIACARLLHRRQDYQEEMVRNYLADAAERFRAECEKHSAADGSDGRRSSLMVQCINAGCNGKAGSSTCYLCNDCFERQRQDEMDRKHSGSPLQAANFQSDGRQSNVETVGCLPPAYGRQMDATNLQLQQPGGFVATSATFYIGTAVGDSPIRSRMVARQPDDAKITGCSVNEVQPRYAATAVMAPDVRPCHGLAPSDGQLRYGSPVKELSPRYASPVRLMTGVLPRSSNAGGGSQDGLHTTSAYSSIYDRPSHHAVSDFNSSSRVPLCNASPLTIEFQTDGGRQYSPRKKFEAQLEEDLSDLQKVAEVDHPTAPDVAWKLSANYPIETLPIYKYTTNGFVSPRRFDGGDYI